MSEHADYCPHCGTPVSLSARRQQEETARTGRPAEDQPARIEAQQEGGTAQQQVIIEKEQPWWIIAAILGVPVGCLLLAALLIVGIPVLMLLLTYGLPFTIAVAIAIWIWYKYPATVRVRTRAVLMTLVLGIIANGLLIAGIVIAFSLSE